MFFIFMGVLVSLVFYFLFLLLSKFYEMSADKTSSFECGFVGLYDSRVSFSVQFFLFALIFLVFDVEVSLLLPSPVVSHDIYFSFFGMIFFLFILLLGLLYEWLKGVFDWGF